MMKQQLQAYLKGDLSDLKIYYHIGNAFAGETEFNLSGDGSYELWSTVTNNRQRREYSGQVKRADVQALVLTMLDVEFWDVTHVSSERGLDNPEVRVEVTAGGKSFPVVLWATEIDDVPAFDTVQEEILALVRQVSDGEVLEVGR